METPRRGGRPRPRGGQRRWEQLAGEQRCRETASGTGSVRDGLNVGTSVFWCFFFFYKEKVLISVFFVSSAYPRGAGRLLARPLAAPRVAFTSEPELGAACGIHTPVPALSILVSLPAAGGAQGPSHHRALNLLARRQSSPPGLPRRQ